MQCQCGEIGRHAGFKIRFLHGSGGSSPPTGTTNLFKEIQTHHQGPVTRGHLLYTTFIAIHTYTFRYQQFVGIIAGIRADRNSIPTVRYILRPHQKIRTDTIRFF